MNSKILLKIINTIIIRRTCDRQNKGKFYPIFSYSNLYRQPSYFSLPVNVMHRTVIEFIISHALDDIFYTFPRDVTVFRSPFVHVFACMIDERHRRVTRYNMCTRQLNGVALFSSIESFNLKFSSSIVGHDRFETNDSHKFDKTRSIWNLPQS